MRVYITRHGESENNRKGLWTGWFDASLTERGIEDAKRAGKVFSGVRFDKVFASDLKRAVETAKNALAPCEIETSELLREIDVGSLACRPLSTITDEERALAYKVGYKAYGGETKEQFHLRVQEFKKMLETLGCENVAVFSHAGWLRAFLNEVLEITVPSKNLCCNNCTVAIFEYTNGEWKLYSWINL